eukprot:TRINITY_DN4776_c0_g1_i2.p1 TRINITY_DN4776_c0_g1~~TRINITY_DN4776_c0_g1_i2.p1  ORF type:complete len:203 (-),score=10.57 TRINITY_DN4776_c0_g1_i2:67-675(-)
MEAALRARKQALQTTVTVETDAMGHKYRLIRNDHGEVVGRTRIEGETAPLIESAPDPAVVEILPMLFLGSQDAAVNVEELDAKGVTHILNVATGIASAFPGRYTYKNVELLDVDETDLLSSLPQCYEFINSARSSSVGVLVHCNAGVSRSASVIIAYLIAHERMKYSEAHEHVKLRRPCIRPNAGFVAQLQRYQELLATSHD